MWKRSTLIENLLSRRREDPSIGVAYFFFTFSDGGKQKVTQILATLAAQMLQQIPVLPASIETWYNNNSSGTALFSGLLLQLIDILLKGFKKTFWVIDGLGEIATSDRTRLLDTLRHLLGEEYQSLNLLFSSRRERYLQELLDQIRIVQCAIQTSVVDEDIRRYVISRIKEDPKLNRWSPQIRDEIQNTLMQGANGM